MVIAPASRRENSVGASSAIARPRSTRKMNAAINSRLPIRPNSSENAAKMKSVVRSGINSRWVCVPCIKPLPQNAAGANGNHALNDVKTLAQRVARRVEQGADPLLLVVVQQRPAHAVGAQLRAQTPPARSCPPNPAPAAERPASSSSRQKRSPTCPPPAPARRCPDPAAS